MGEDIEHESEPEHIEICSWCGFPLVLRKDNGECVECWKLWEEEGSM